MAKSWGEEGLKWTLVTGSSFLSYTGNLNFFQYRPTVRERACGVGCTREWRGERVSRVADTYYMMVYALMGPRQRRGAKERDELVVLWRQVM